MFTLLTIILLFSFTWCLDKINTINMTVTGFTFRIIFKVAKFFIVLWFLGTLLEVIS